MVGVRENADGKTMQHPHLRVRAVLWTAPGALPSSQLLKDLEILKGILKRKSASS
jgi:hypothetical protein